MRRFFLNASASSTHFPSSSKEASNSPSYLSLCKVGTGNELTLPDEVYHHWCRVLRAKVGEESVLFDGLGGESLVELVTINKKQATVKVKSYHTEDRSNPYFSTIAIVMSRGDRMDYAIQKSTELGVTAIQLLTSQHGEVRLKPEQIDKKLAHWQQVALSACEQCGLNRPPLLLSPRPIKEWLKGDTGQTHASLSYLTEDSFYQAYVGTDPLKLVLAVPSLDQLDTIDIKSSMHSYKQKNNDADLATRYDVLIGAEGGLTSDEYEHARTKGYLPWMIGNRVLRTETAPVAALSILLDRHLT